MDFFSTSFDLTVVNFLEDMNVPAYKIASFELVDLPLIRNVAATHKPVILSTGMATLAEIDDAIRAFRDAGGTELALLKCNSAYPALAEEMNLRTIPHLAETFGVPVGLSDHTLDNAVAVAAVALGACIVEKHITPSQSARRPDSGFSSEPHEFKDMVQAIRSAEKALGSVTYEVTEKEKAVRGGGHKSRAGVHQKEFAFYSTRARRATKASESVLGEAAKCDVKKGTPMSWDFLAQQQR